MNIWIKPLADKEAFPLTTQTECQLRHYYWSPDSSRIIFLQDNNGNENWRINIAIMGTKDVLEMTPYPGTQARIVSIHPLFTDEILVGLNSRVKQYHDVHRLNIKNGRMLLDQGNNIGAVHFFADNHMNVRIAHQPRLVGGAKLKYFSAEEEEWIPILGWDNEDDMTTRGVGFGPSEDFFYIVSSIGSRTSEFRTINVKSRQETVIASDPDVDISDWCLHPLKRHVQAVAFTKDRKEWVVVDDQVTEDFSELKLINNGDISIVSRDLHDTAWIIKYSHDSYPDKYYIYNPQQKSAQELFDTHSDLKQYSFASSTPVSFKASDDLNIPGYLTLPNHMPAKNLPTIIHIHGGPWLRTNWEWHDEALWLADRGYAVLRVNFRGSLGYGKDFVNAGNLEWGGKIQSDIRDAALWLIDQGIADPKRIGLFGKSFGGFSVLSGLTQFPDLYACGVDIVGPSNLLTFIEIIPPYWEPLSMVFYKRVGHPDKDFDMLTAISPINHVDKIRAPLLIAQGANDPRVPKSESIQIRDALLNAGKQVEYIEFANEGHGFNRPENKELFYKTAEKFLAKYLEGKCE